MMKNFEEAIKCETLKLGYESCGIIKASFYEEFASEIAIRSDSFPHSANFYEHIKGMADPKEKAPWAESIIVCLRRYDKYQIPKGLDRFIGKVFLFDGRLSYSMEYTGKMKFETYIKELGYRIEPISVPARWAAAKAGLGKFRNNNFLYTQHGSWNWIDTWAIDKQVEQEEPFDDVRYTCPKNCRRCVEACPTGALSAPLKMDATRCIAYLSFDEKSSLPTDIRTQMGTYLYGCDECQNACPFNAWKGEDTFMEPLPLEEIIDLENLFFMDEETYRTVLQPRFWYIGKEEFWQWKCNVIRAMANQEPKLYLKYFIQASKDPDEKVKEMALWALNKANNNN